MSTAIPFSSVSMSLRSDRASSCFAFSIYKETIRSLWNTHVYQTHQNFITRRSSIRSTRGYNTSTFSSADVGSERNSRAFDRGRWSTSPNFCLCSKWLPLLMKESSLLSIGPLIVPFFFGFHFLENRPPRSPNSFSLWKMRAKQKAFIQPCPWHINDVQTSTMTCKLQLQLQTYNPK
jgi:hypothetical protein